MFNSLGQKVHPGIDPTGNQELAIDLQGEPKGLYFLIIRHEEGQASKRLMVE